MNKYTLFGVIVAWLVIATFLFNAADVYLGTDDFDVTAPISDIDTTGDSELDIAVSLGDTFIELLLIQYTGLPVIFNLVLFTVPTFILGFIALEIFIKIAAAIIPF